MKKLFCRTISSPSLNAAPARRDASRTSPVVPVLRPMIASIYAIPSRASRWRVGPVEPEAEPHSWMTKVPLAHIQPEQGRGSDGARRKRYESRPLSGTSGVAHAVRSGGDAGCRYGNTLRQKDDEVGLPCRDDGIALSHLHVPISGRGPAAAAFGMEMPQRSCSLLHSTRAQRTPRVKLSLRQRFYAARQHDAPRASDKSANDDRGDARIVMTGGL